MEKDNSKIITLSFIAAGFLAAMVIRVLLETAALASGAMARFYAQDWVRHGFPLVAGFGTFLVLQFSPSLKRWADEVVVEIRKIVWPSRKDTMGMTVVVIVMLLVASVILGTFDLFCRGLIRSILN